MRINQGQEFVIGGYAPTAKSFATETTSSMLPGHATASHLRCEPASFDSSADFVSTLAHLPESRNGRFGEGFTAQDMRTCHWLKPSLVGKFEFAEWTQPIICAIHDSWRFATIKWQPISEEKCDLGVGRTDAVLND